MQSPDPAADRAVTLVIPTVHHRAELFARTLRYLGDSGFRCPVIVSDHSPPEQLGIIADIARQHGNANLKLLSHAPDLHFLTRLSLCAAMAETPYVHLHADDDFLLRSVLDRLVREMEARPDCAAAMGINAHVTFATKDIAILAKVAIGHPGPFDRLIAQLENYSSVLYALRRRDEFIKSLSFAVERCPDVQFWQYLESCVNALEGPIAVVDDLHYVRERHAGKWSATLVRERSPDHFPYLILSGEFSPRVAAFRAALVAACEARQIRVDLPLLDNGLVHLLYRGIAAMGLPPKRFGAADPSQAAARAWARLRNAADPAAIELNRIVALGSAPARV
jgi:glycosyltransferase domain-containing protein